MKVTKRQLKQIIAEEKQKITSQKNFGSNADRQEKLREGRMAEMEMQLVDEIVDLLIKYGAVRSDEIGGSLEQEYSEAAEYLKWAIIPHLESV